MNYETLELNLKVKPRGLLRWVSIPEPSEAYFRTHGGGTAQELGLGRPSLRKPGNHRRAPQG